MGFHDDPTYWLFAAESKNVAQAAIYFMETLTADAILVSVIYIWGVQEAYVLYDELQDVPFVHCLEPKTLDMSVPSDMLGRHRR